MKLAHCPKCGRNTIQGNALAIYCMYCGFQVVDPEPLPNTREERMRILNYRRRKKR